MSAAAAELAGTRLLKILNMVNTSMTHVFRHPKFYRIPRDKSDQAISESKTVDIGDSVRPDPGHKQQASSGKLQATSAKHQAPSSDKKL